MCFILLYGKSSQDTPINTRVPRGSILGSFLFLPLFFKDLPDDVAFKICNIATYHDDTTLCLTGAPHCYLDMFDKLQKLECGEASSTPASLRRWNVAILSPFCR